jgi:hypothetical protein
MTRTVRRAVVLLATTRGLAAAAGPVPYPRGAGRGKGWNVSIRRILVAAAACFLAGVAAAPASAAPPSKVPRTPGSFILSGTCEGFDIRIDDLAQQSTSRDLGNGLFAIAGAVNGTITRLNPDGSDGASLALNWSGAGVIDSVNDVIYARGPWLLTYFDDVTTPEFEGSAYLVKGMTVFTSDHVVSSTAPVLDICAALA